MTLAGLQYLGYLAQSVPENGVIVEIGPLFGSSTWVLSKNAPASAKIISIDTWEPQPWIDKIEAKFPGCHPFSIDAFKHYTSDCPNVEAIQGWSPDVVRDYPFKSVHMVFDDATHGDPGFTKNIEFFLPLLVEGGILCGDDYASGWPDIVKNVDWIGRAWNQDPEICGRVWSVIKPSGIFDRQQTRPRDIIRLSEQHVPLSLDVRLLSGKEIHGAPLCWAGASHKQDAITQLRVVCDATNAVAASGIEIEVEGVNGERAGPAKINEWLGVPGERLTGFFVHANSGLSDYNIRYQGCELTDVKGKTGNTNSVDAGKWLKADNGASFTALRMIVEKRNV